MQLSDSASTPLARYNGSMTELRVEVSEQIAERLAEEAAERGTSPEDVAAEVLRLHVPGPHAAKRPAFVGLFAGPAAVSAAEAERSLEDGEYGGFGR